MARRRYKRQGEVTDSRQSLPLTHESAQRFPGERLLAPLRRALAGFVYPGYGEGLPMFSHGLKTGTEVFYGAAARKLRPPPSPLPDKRLVGRLLMRVPSRVQFCVDRKARREVLFAFKRAGYRGSAPRSYKRTDDSQYSCVRR